VAHFPNSNIGNAIRNCLFSAASIGCRLLGNLVVFVIIARLPAVQTEDFGQLTFAISLVSCFVMASQYGLAPLFIRNAAAEPEQFHLYIQNVLGLRLGLTCLSSCALWGYVNSASLDAQTKLICYVMAGALYLGSFSADLQAAFQSKEKMQFETLGIFAENTALVTLILTAFIFKFDIVEVAFLFLISKSLSLIINYTLAVRCCGWIYPKLAVGVARKLMNDATPFALAGLVSFGIVQVDTLLLQQLSPGNPYDEVGIYQAASRFFLVPLLIPEIALKVFLPQLARLHGASKLPNSRLAVDLGRLNHLLMTLGLLIGLVTFFRGKDIVSEAYGAKYHEAGALLELLGITVAMRFGAAFNLYFTLGNRIWFRFFSSLWGLVAIVSLNILLIPRYGARGCVYASIIGTAIYWIPWLIAIFKLEGSAVLGWRYRQAVSAAVALGLFAHITADFQVLLMLPLYAGLCLVLAVVTMKNSDRQLVINQARLSRRNLDTPLT
jgi:O-antigen/teichoic acid export membrane protein